MEFIKEKVITRLLHNKFQIILHTHVSDKPNINGERDVSIEFEETQINELIQYIKYCYILLDQNRYANKDKCKNVDEFDFIKTHFRGLLYGLVWCIDDLVSMSIYYYDTYYNKYEITPVLEFEELDEIKSYRN